jgi:hydroxyethylthiazole kinase-like sugar kinase family protein
MSCRLFDANNSEMIGIIRFGLESLEVNHPLVQQKTGTNRVYQDLSAANPLVAGSSPARPMSEAPE